MTQTTNNLSFLEWSKNKNPNDYWYASNVPEDFAIKQYNHFYKTLKKQALKCKQVTWFVTNNCDLNCSHCGVSANQRKFKELTFNDFIQIIPTLKKIGVEYITLSGGEPLLRKDINQIVDTLKANDFKVGMVSNGTKMEEFCSNFKEHKLDSILISIDGLEENHSKVRKSNTNFKKAVEAIKIAKQAGVKMVSVNTCVFPENITDLEPLKELLFSQGIDQWTLRPVSPSGRANNKAEYELSYEQIKDLLLYVKDNLEKDFEITVGSDLGYLGKLDSYLYLAPYFFSLGWNSMVILPNGDIKGFDEEHLPLEGNIFQDDLEEIWLTKFLYYRKPDIPEACITCTYLSRCRGGNLATAELGKRCIKPVLEMLETYEG